MIVTKTATVTLTVTVTVAVAVTVTMTVTVTAWLCKVVTHSGKMDRFLCMHSKHITWRPVPQLDAAFARRLAHERLATICTGTHGKRPRMR